MRRDQAHRPAQTATPATSDDALAAGEIAAVSALAFGCFGLTAPFSGFHSAVTGGTRAAAPPPPAIRLTAAGLFGRAVGIFAR